MFLFLFIFFQLPIEWNRMKFHVSIDLNSIMKSSGKEEEETEYKQITLNSIFVLLRMVLYPYYAHMHLL